LDGVGERRVDKRASGAGRGVCRFDARRDATGRVYEYQCPSPALVHNAERVALTVEELKAVRITSAEVEAVNRGIPSSYLPHTFRMPSSHIPWY
jgi:tRNA U38,U39,U40 pseudouridine synthase TruA